MKRINIMIIFTIMNFMACYMVYDTPRDNKNDPGGDKYVLSENLPTVTIAVTVNVNVITVLSTVSKGTTAVTARGICWSTSPNPIISNSHTTNGIGTGSFTVIITDLFTSSALYFIRAYATNNAGTAYSDQISSNILE